jgi:hypothetical protein
MAGVARGCVLAAVVAMLFLASIVRAQAAEAGAWDGCSGLVSIPGEETVELKAPPGSAGLVLPYTGSPPPNPGTGEAHVNAGALELLQQEDSAELVRQGGGPTLFVTGPARFTVAAAVRISPLKSAAGATKWQAELKPGEGVVVRVPEGVPVRRQPVPVQPDLIPSSDGPLVTVRVSMPGKVLTDGDWQQGLRACFIPVGGKTGRPLPIEAVNVSDLGVADVALRAPDNLFGSDGRWIGAASFLVYDKGDYMAEGQVGSWRPILAALVSAALTMTIFGALAAAANKFAERLGTGTKAFLFGLFTSRDGDASLSLFQVFLWTVVTVWALGYVFLRTSDVLTLTPQIMVLLGFASAASVAARWIASGRSPAPAIAAQHKPEFWAMLMSDGRPDLLKVQLFAFTLLGVAYVAWRVATSTAFPVLDENLLLLMGVSNLAYVGGKLAEPTPYQKADALSRVRDVAAARVTSLEAELNAAKAAKAAEEAEPTPDPTKLKRLADDIERLGGKDGKGGELGKARQELADAEKALARPSCPTMTSVTAGCTS